jgi:hypothetical protein
MNELSPEQLLQNPRLAQALGLFSLLCLAATISLIIWLIRRWQKGGLGWNQLTSIDLSLPGLIGFLGFLTSATMSFGNVAWVATSPG